VYALTTHAGLLSEKPSAFWTCGRATFTMVPSSDLGYLDDLRDPD
jgi:hypothetical protein